MNGIELQTQKQTYIYIEYCFIKEEPCCISGEWKIYSKIKAEQNSYSHENTNKKKYDFCLTKYINSNYTTI